MLDKIRSIAQKSISLNRNIYKDIPIWDNDETIYCSFRFVVDSHVLINVVSHMPPGVFSRSFLYYQKDMVSGIESDFFIELPEVHQKSIFDIINKFEKSIDFALNPCCVEAGLYGHDMNWSFAARFCPWCGETLKQNQVEGTSHTDRFEQLVNMVNNV